MDKTMSQLEFESIIQEKSGGKEDKIEVMCNSKVYAKKLNSSHLSADFYYLVLWKGYSEEKNIWEPALAI